MSIQLPPRIWDGPRDAARMSAQFGGQQRMNVMKPWRFESRPQALSAAEGTEQNNDEAGVKRAAAHGSPCTPFAISSWPRQVLALEPAQAPTCTHLFGLSLMGDHLSPDLRPPIGSWPPPLGQYVSYGQSSHGSPSSSLPWLAQNSTPSSQVVPAQVPALYWLPVLSYHVG